MRAGTLRERIAILAPVDKLDPVEGWIVDYQELETVWASVKAVSSTEAATTSAITTSTRYEVVTRYHPKLDSKCRLAWRLGTLDIAEVIADEKQRELRITAYLSRDRKGDS